ncbi:MarR family transcriptional regulator [Bradyrhizobium diazoefficiens]|nr:MarR family transcriptional regulator [Bradyrhizobium diazoefficiens]QQO21734.1 MarR family transcriptional regulator [Bradyrhizobium diazoefficiens]
MSRKSVDVTKSQTARAMSATAAGTAVRVPAPGEGKRGEQGYLGYLLRQAHAAVRLTTERTLADLGVTSPQFAVLTMLNAYPGLSGADVARLTFLTPQTVGVIIRNLERDGAILKTPHPVHGRIQQWTLTPRGARLLKACRERVMALESRLARNLDSKAETAIRRWLAGLAADLQED